MLFNTLSSWLVINGQYAEEFNIEQSDVDGVPQITCWVASQVGKNFQVHYRDQTRRTFRATVSIDGNKCGGRILRNGKISGHLDGISTSSTTLRPFVFSSLSFTEEEDLSTMGSLSNVGQIEVAIAYVVILGNDALRPYQVPAEQKVNEKAKKGIDHQTRFGDTVQQDVMRAVKTRRIGKDVVRFCFRYRPLEVLRAHGIAPPAPIPVASTSTSSSQRTKKRRASDEPEDVKPTTVDDDEVLIVSDSEDEKQRTLNRRKKMKIKREQVKREPLVVPMSGEVIDLT
ncbi:hypothetical protein BT96DRAFT_102887 [Gymnopus androsaceus JB14]|uniref:DUF7918 domain-containing protein n=1 Tax=Gymnopus androsaceus JB14 TaxID=1447944 RepID=A0A6A4GC94_9AGAR|nr:hypothetical protein BT96DRAFT_102887 [Gymnopus androsaceus JB14]